MSSEEPVYTPKLSSHLPVAVAVLGGARDVRRTWDKWRHNFLYIGLLVLVLEVPDCDNALFGHEGVSPGNPVFTLCKMCQVYTFEASGQGV